MSYQIRFGTVFADFGQHSSLLLFSIPMYHRFAGTDQKIRYRGSISDINSQFAQDQDQELSNLCHLSPLASGHRRSRKLVILEMSAKTQSQLITLPHGRIIYWRQMTIQNLIPRNRNPGIYSKSASHPSCFQTPPKTQLTRRLISPRKTSHPLLPRYSSPSPFNYKLRTLDIKQRSIVPRTLQINHLVSNQIRSGFQGLWDRDWEAGCV